jgi:hypothetical protein
MENVVMEHRVARLERRTHWWRFAWIAQLGLFAAIWISMSHQGSQVLAQSSPQTLRIRELIIEDAEGRPRILIGAPFPSVKERTRQDSRTTSILFLDEKGHDRLTLGEELEPQINGKVPAGVHRIASGFGVVIHDGAGDERGAYGWLSNGRALITLDRPGTEAFAAMVNDKTGETKVSLGFPPEIANDTSAIEIGTKASSSFLRFNGKSGTSLAVFDTQDGKNPSFRTFDQQGSHSEEHLKNAP